MGDGRITVFLADDNVIVREGVRALLALEPDLDVVGTADDYDSLLAGAGAAAPQVLVTEDSTRMFCLPGPRTESVACESRSNPPSERGGWPSVG